MSDAEFDASSEQIDEAITQYLLGDLPQEQVRKLETRMAEDSLLRVRVYEARHLLDQLKTIPAETARPDFADGVMKCLREKEPHAPAMPHEPGQLVPFPWLKVTALAASLALLAGLFALRTPPPPADWVRQETISTKPAGSEHKRKNVQNDMAWLEQVQLPDGSWDAAAWGGNWQARPGLTALVLCGLLKHADANVPLTPDADTAAQRALRYLLAYATEANHPTRVTALQRQQLIFVAAALHEARDANQDANLAAQIEEALTRLGLPETEPPATVVSAMLPHLPEQAATQGGRIYLIARALLLDT